MAIFLLWWILYFMSHHQVYSSECAHDKDCDSDYYCLVPFCEPCIPCEEIFNRKTPPSLTGKALCARDSSECGLCLQGFTMYELTGSTVDAPSFECVHYSPGHNIDSFTDLNPLANPIIIIIFFLSILVVVSTCIFIDFRKNLTVLGIKIQSPRSLPSDPPPYSESGYTIAIGDEEFASIPRPPPYSVIDPRLVSDERRHASLLNESQRNAPEACDSDPVHVDT